MAKNLIPEIAKMLGVELGEEFKVVSKDGSERACVFNHDGLLDNTTYAYYNKELFADIICGKLEIIKLPWKPTLDDNYYTFKLVRGKWSVCVGWWENEPHCYALLEKGWIYRTKAEAEAALPKVAKEIGVNYILEGEAK